MAATPAAGASPPERVLAMRIGAAQVDALFHAVVLGVSGAAGASIVLAGMLLYLRISNPTHVVGWSGFIVACAAAHILLRSAYLRRARPAETWRIWAACFTAIALLEGIGWGWAPIALAGPDRFDIQLLVVAVTLGIAAGSVPAFSPCLPAFLALFLPATLPFMVVNLLSFDVERQAACLLTVMFIGGIGGLGAISNRSFRRLVGQRLEIEAIAADLRREKDIAERASLAKSTFLAAASHDLRQPVHALGLFVGALRGVAMAPEGVRLIEQIEASAHAMDGLFTALLDISRLDAGVVAVHRRPFAVAPLLERICREHRQEAADKGIRLVLKRSDAVLDSDPILIERILRNLISNALRYTDRGRVVIAVRLRGRRMALQVWDTGPGIEADQQERVFQEYYQLGNAERDRTKGLGLGLAIVRRLAGLLACELTLCSRPGHGSCFQVLVPLAAGVSRSSEPEVTELPGALAGGLVVVVDDELAIREAMSTLLSGWGHEVIAAGSGAEAMQRLSRCPVRPTLLICDYRLRDGENGIEIVEQLRSEYNETIPAMLITGDTAPDRLAEAQRSGLLLLHKPVSNSKLRAAIVNLVASAETTAAEETDAAAVR